MLVRLVLAVVAVIAVIAVAVVWVRPWDGDDDERPFLGLTDEQLESIDRVTLDESSLYNGLGTPLASVRELYADDRKALELSGPRLVTVEDHDNDSGPARWWYVIVPVIGALLLLGGFAILRARRTGS